MNLYKVVFGWAIDCRLAYKGEDYIGARYIARLVKAELSETSWVLLFGESGFTFNGEYQPHFVDLMIKSGWNELYRDELCAPGWPPTKAGKNVTFEIGLTDYEDSHYSLYDNDIAMWSRNPGIFPRRFSNVDSYDKSAADKIMAEYQIDRGGTLEGREIEVILERAEETTLSQNINYYMDPDANCLPNSQEDILYRHWIVTFCVPSLGIKSKVDIYINATQGDKLRGTEILNFMWENPGRAAIESDKFKVIIYDPEVKTVSRKWEKVEKFLVDWRTPKNELPENKDGKFLGGFRKVAYKGEPAIEASFGYGHNDYVLDGDPVNRDPAFTMGLIDLSYLPKFSLSGTVTDATSSNPVKKATVKIKRKAKKKRGAPLTVKTNKNGQYKFEELDAGTYRISVSKSRYKVYKKKVNLDGKIVHNVKLKKK